MTSFAPPVVAWRGSQEPTAPLVVLLHGRGSHEQEILGLADALPAGLAYAAVRAPIAEGGGYAWFANRGVGRPLPESLADAVAWFRGWLDEVAPAGRPVLLVGFSGGATFAGGVALDDPRRIAGLATTYATLPFDAGLPTTPGRLAGLPVLVAQGDADTVIPVELQRRTWDYLHHDSGAAVTARRSPGGHALTRDDVDALAAWLAAQVSTALHSRADVVTDTPERYAKQLVAHLGRKLEFVTDGPTSTTTLDGSTGQVVVGDGVLTLFASGDDEAGLARVEHVLGSHLERFGQRNELVVTWSRDPAPTG